MVRLKKFGYTIAITFAGLIACWAASMVIVAIEIVVLAQLSPSWWDGGGPAHTPGRLALRLAGCLGLMVGGYVSAWFASRMQKSEVKHAMLVGCVYGVLGVLSNDPQPISWGLACFVFLIAVIASSLGGWFREAQVRRYQATPAPPRFK